MTSRPADSRRKMAWGPSSPLEPPDAPPPVRRCKARTNPSTAPAAAFADRRPPIQGDACEQRTTEHRASARHPQAIPARRRAGRTKGVTMAEQVINSRSWERLRPYFADADNGTDEAIRRNGVAVLFGVAICAASALSSLKELGLVKFTGPRAADAGGYFIFIQERPKPLHRRAQSNHRHACAPWRRSPVRRSKKLPPRLPHLRPFRSSSSDCLSVGQKLKSSVMPSAILFQPCRSKRDVV